MEYSGPFPPKTCQTCAVKSDQVNLLHRNKVLQDRASVYCLRRFTPWLKYDPKTGLASGPECGLGYLHAIHNFKGQGGRDYLHKLKQKSEEERKQFVASQETFIQSLVNGSTVAQAQKETNTLLSAEETNSQHREIHWDFYTVAYLRKKKIQVSDDEIEEYEDNIDRKLYQGVWRRATTLFPEDNEILRVVTRGGVKVKKDMELEKSNATTREGQLAETHAAAVAAVHSGRAVSALATIAEEDPADIDFDSEPRSKVPKLSPDNCPKRPRSSGTSEVDEDSGEHHRTGFGGGKRRHHPEPSNWDRGHGSSPIKSRSGKYVIGRSATPAKASGNEGRGGGHSWGNFLQPSSVHVKEEPKDPEDTDPPEEKDPEDDEESKKKRKAVIPDKPLAKSRRIVKVAGFSKMLAGFDALLTELMKPGTTSMSTFKPSSIKNWEGKLSEALAWEKCCTTTSMADDPLDDAVTLMKNVRAALETVQALKNVAEVIYGSSAFQGEARELGDKEAKEAKEKEKDMKEAEYSSMELQWTMTELSTRPQCEGIVPRSLFMSFLKKITEEAGEDNLFDLVVTAVGKTQKAGTLNIGALKVETGEDAGKLQDKCFSDVLSIVLQGLKRTEKTNITSMIDSLLSFFQTMEKADLHDDLKVTVQNFVTVMCPTGTVDPVDGTATPVPTLDLSAAFSNVKESSAWKALDAPKNNAKGESGCPELVSEIATKVNLTLEAASHVITLEEIEKKAEDAKETDLGIYADVLMKMNRLKKTTSPHFKTMYQERINQIEVLLEQVAVSLKRKVNEPYCAAINNVVTTVAEDLARKATLERRLGDKASWVNNSNTMLATGKQNIRQAKLTLRPAAALQINRVASVEETNQFNSLHKDRQAFCDVLSNVVLPVIYALDESGGADNFPEDAAIRDFLVNFSMPQLPKSMQKTTEPEKPVPEDQAGEGGGEGKEVPTAAKEAEQTGAENENVEEASSPGAVDGERGPYDEDEQERIGRKLDGDREEVHQHILKMAFFNAVIGAGAMAAWAELVGGFKQAIDKNLREEFQKLHVRIEIPSAAYAAVRTTRWRSAAVSEDVYRSLPIVADDLEKFAQRMKDLCYAPEIMAVTHTGTPIPTAVLLGSAKLCMAASSMVRFRDASGRSELKPTDQMPDLSVFFKHCIASERDLQTFQGFVTDIANAGGEFLQQLVNTMDMDKADRVQLLSTCIIQPLTVAANAIPTYDILQDVKGIVDKTPEAQWSEKMLDIARSTDVKMILLETNKYDDSMTVAEESVGKYKGGVESFFDENEDWHAAQNKVQVARTVLSVAKLIQACFNKKSVHLKAQKVTEALAQVNLPTKKLPGSFLTFAKSLT